MSTVSDKLQLDEGASVPVELLEPAVDSSGPGGADLNEFLGYFRAPNLETGKSLTATK